MFWLAWYTKPCLGWEHPSPSAGPLGWKGFCQQAVVSVQAGGTGQTDRARRAAPGGRGQTGTHSKLPLLAREQCPVRELSSEAVLHLPTLFFFPPGLHLSGTAYPVFGTFQKWLENFLSFLCSALSAQLWKFFTRERWRIIAAEGKGKNF